MKPPRQRKPTVKVKNAKARYRRFLNILPDAILVHCGGKCVFANTAAVSLFGAASPRKMLGLDVLDLLHPDFGAFVQQRIDAAYGGELEKIPEIKILRLDGHPVDVEIMAMAINYHGLPAIQVMLREITLQKCSSEAARSGDLSGSQGKPQLQGALSGPSLG